METVSTLPHWLDDYASKRFEWQCLRVNDQITFWRPLGHVESVFDADGRHYEGRADLNSLLELEVKSQLSRDELHERILLAWTYLRCRHLLLQSKAITRSQAFGKAEGTGDEIGFAINVPDNAKGAVEAAAEHVVFLDDHYDRVQTQDFWIHCQNTSRVVDPDEALAKMFVFPSEATSNGRHRLRFLFVGSHQIWDGLTTYVWHRDMVHAMNRSAKEQLELLISLLDPKSIRERLPLPQEALYPPIAGSLARQRWFWLITRILRHVRKPLQAGFANPLSRKEPHRPVSLSPTYASVLDYSKIPPLNTFPCILSISLANTQRLHRLCREAKVSVGAGCFALAALVMMEMYEEMEPGIPLSKRLPFISGFPLNPRPFFNHHTEPDSLMLAFCDGITLPFLSCKLNLDGRIRLLSRQAHRQLASFQKRTRPAGSEAELEYMSSRGAGRVIANQYTWGIERTDSILPEHLRKEVNPQGQYPMQPNVTRQTCGVSSVGRNVLVTRGMYDLEDGTKDFVADFHGTNSSVRARDGEFLVGIGGSERGLGVMVSIDGSSIDPALVQKWSDKLEHILDEGGDRRIARL